MYPGWFVLATAVSFVMQSLGAATWSPSLGEGRTSANDDGDGISGLASRSFTPREAGGVVTVHRADAGREVSGEPTGLPKAGKQPDTAGSKAVQDTAVKGAPERQATPPAPKAAAPASVANHSGSGSVSSEGESAGRKVFVMVATAYGPGDSGNFGDVDAFGRPLHLGVVAVDPKVIPLGSKVLVKGLRAPGVSPDGFFAVASDTGGAIKGHRIDIYLPLDRQELLQVGMQQVTVEVVGRSAAGR